MKFWPRPRAGVSLVELMASMAIMGVVILVVINLFISSGKFSSAEQLRIDVSENATRVLATMDETLRAGRAVVTSVVYNSVTYTTGDSTVVLTTPSPQADGTLSPSEVDTMILYLDASNSANKAIRRIIAATGIGSTRSTGTSDVVQGVNDVYFRYTTDDPTDATVVTAIVTTQKTVNNLPFNAAMILNATLHNHP